MTRGIRPQRSYVVCATPRSGSTLLCKTLADTGVAGRPEEYFEARAASGIPRRPREYFDDAPGTGLAAVPDVDPPAHAYSDLRGVRDYRAHLRATLERGTTPNGVFGAKLMWMHVDDLLALARTLPEHRGAGLRELLAALLGDVRYVWVRRRDGVAQAVSLWRAMQTQAWRSDADEPPAPGSEPEPRYDFPALHHLVGRLQREDAAWGRWFAEHAIEPLELFYEELVDDPRAAADAVMLRIGLTLQPATGDGSPPLTRQADDTSTSWAQRYRAEMV